jgi:SAM-dependent methyltransferase
VAKASEFREGGVAEAVPQGARRPGTGLAGELPGQVGLADRDRPDGPADQAFMQYVLEYAAQRAGQAIVLLQAGCTTAGSELDLAELREQGCNLVVSLIDDDSRVTQAAVDAHQELHSSTLGDMRRVPLVPRSVDIVQCSMLLDRISHADLVLGRLIETIRPGGLLLLRVTDRDSAAGFLDRTAPQLVRGLIWRRMRPGEPGPYPAVHEELVSVRGIQSFAARRGLVIAHRQVRSRLADRDARHEPAGLLAARRLASALSIGRLAWAHDELRYVIRKPEDRFARVL